MKRYIIMEKRASIHEHPLDGDWMEVSNVIEGIFHAHRMTCRCSTGRCKACVFARTFLRNMGAERETPEPILKQVTTNGNGSNLEPSRTLVA